MERRNIGIGIGAIILIVGLFLTIGPMFNLFTILALSGYDTIIDHVAQTARLPIQKIYQGTEYTMFLSKSSTPTSNVLVSVTRNGTVIKTFTAPLTACSSASCVGYFGTTSPAAGGFYGEPIVPQAVCFVNINNGPIVILANPLYGLGTQIVQGEVFCYSSLAIKITATPTISTCQNSCGNLKQASWPDCGCIAGVCANTCPSSQLQRAAPDCSCYSPSCGNTCAAGQSQYPYPTCTCYTPPTTCTNTCASGQSQNPYPDCSCVNQNICSNSCPGGQTQRAYPDCSCYNPTVACDSSCQSGCVGTIATNCSLSVCGQAVSGKTICENGTLSGCLPIGTVPTCEDTNKTCEATWAPVCGTNLQTYPNECMAGKNSVSILFNGACPRDIQWLGMALILIALIWLVIVMLKW